MTAWHETEIRVDSIAFRRVELHGSHDMGVSSEEMGSMTEAIGGVDLQYECMGEMLQECGISDSTFLRSPAALAARI